MRVQVFKAGEPASVVDMAVTRVCTIGRVPGNDLVIAERGVSSHHARLEIDSAGRLRISDLGSTNGTFVNGERIVGPTVVTPVDEVFVCHIQLEILADAGERAPAQRPETTEALEVGAGDSGPPAISQLRPPGPVTIGEGPAPLEPAIEATPAMRPSAGSEPAVLEPAVLEPALVGAGSGTPDPRAPAMPEPLAGPERVETPAPADALAAPELPAPVHEPPTLAQTAEPALPPALGSVGAEPVAEPGSPEVHGAAERRVEGADAGGDPLAALRQDPELRRIVIRGLDEIVVERGHGPQRLPGGFTSLARLHAALDRWFGSPQLGSQAWDERQPWLDRLGPDGARVRGAHPNVAPGGPIVVITRPQRPADEVELGLVGEVPDPVADYLRILLQARGSLLIGVDSGCDAAALLAGCARQLQAHDPSPLALVRAGVAIPAPAGAMVLDAEERLTAAAVRLAVDAGATRLIVHRGDGAGLASAWAGLSRGLAQLIVTVRAAEPAAALDACVDGLVLGGFGRDRDRLRRHVAVAIDAIVTLQADAGGREAVVGLAELDERGQPVDILRRAAPDQPWSHYASPAFVPVMARQGLSFDPARLAALARA